MNKEELFPFVKFMTEMDNGIIYTHEERIRRSI